MCEPVTLGSLTISTNMLAAIGTAVSVASAAATTYGQYQSGKAQAALINQQNELQAEQIADRAGAEMTERARAARRERASMRASASESGISLDSGSFLAALQESYSNQYNDAGTIAHNERAAQARRRVDANSAMSQVQVPTALSAALTIGSTYIGASTEYRTAARTGSEAATRGG